MREIKFRAWDEKRSELVYFDLNLCNDESRSWYNQQIDGNHIMQYTGLKDKNGVEIYEDDIVNTDYIKNAKVIFDGKQEGSSSFGFAFEIINRPEEGIFYFQTGIEVIGNIYENPELLEAK